ncbi:hypothetical protein T11_2615 [Trichinella zimbabwensis]|uniref:Uncharacterized protein n=1 Tax=Trichinella zimbabwensis TaxID=268475 RepID=A0A0V1H236_9BILA|nr:hypothetical protein T11_2615 [Trichinella zimbabwensis]
MGMGDRDFDRYNRRRKNRKNTGQRKEKKLCKDETAAVDNLSVADFLIVFKSPLATHQNNF